MQTRLRLPQRLIVILWLLVGAAFGSFAVPNDSALAQEASQQAVPASSASGLPPELAKPVEELSKSIEAAEKALQHLKEVESELGQLRIDVEAILKGSVEAAEQLRPRLAAIKDQIGKLGPAPAKDAPAEPAAVATERARLNAEATAVEGAIKTAELTWVRARQLIERITVLRHSLFTRNLFERLASPLLPSLWRHVASELPAIQQRLSYLGNDWWSWARPKQTELALLTAGIILAYVIARLIVGWIARRAAREPPPSFIERAASAAWVAPMRAVPAALAVLLLYGELDILNLLYQPWDGLAAGIAQGALLFIGIKTLLATVFGVREPSWRLFDLSDTSARRVCRLLQSIAAVFAVDLALTAMARAFFIPLVLSVSQSLVASLTYAVLLIALLLTPFEPQVREPPAPPRLRYEPRWLKLPLWLVAFGIIAGCVAGYMALSRFAAHQLVTTGLVVLIAALLYLAISSLLHEPATPGHPIGDLMENRFGLDPPRRRQLARLVDVSLALVLGLCALPIIMLQWGFSGADIRDWFQALLFGFEIGQFKISLARILIGLALFAALLLATRLVQRLLRDRVLQRQNVDAGIANSIETVAGYVGTSVAAIVAISYAGLDITNLAIVAGALSVGIGFGLQSIVNNFVSGLILLIERPIKVGDWIVVGNEQGNVRRISVRATEIETFDRASLIVPNSELITGRVLNWTHRNLMARAVLKVGADYSADARKIMQILKRCAEEHPLVLEAPEPQVVFEGFGDSSLDFSLRFVVADLTRSLQVQSEVRIAILEAFRAEGIEIPFSQHDIHLRDLDAFRSVLARVAEKAQGADGKQADKQPIEPASPVGRED